MKEIDTTLLCMRHVAGGNATTPLLLHGQLVFIVTCIREAGRPALSPWATGMLPFP